MISILLFFIETWLVDSHFTAEFMGDSSFNVVRKNRCVDTTGFLRGGGILIAVRSCFSCRQLELSSNNLTASTNFEVDQLILKILFSLDFDLFLIARYLPPGSPLELYELHFDNCRTLLDNLGPSQHVVFTGDFNLADIVWESNKFDSYLIPYNVATEKEIEFIDFFSLYDLVQVNPNKKSFNHILDLMFVDKEFIVNIELADSPILNNSLLHNAFIVDFSILHYQKISNS